MQWDADALPSQVINLATGGSQKRSDYRTLSLSMAVASFLLERFAHPFGILYQRSVKLNFSHSDVGRKLALDVKLLSIEESFCKDLWVEAISIR